MCLLCFTPAGQEIDYSRLEHASINNPDGFGWALNTGQRIITGRFMKYEDALDGLQRVVREYPDCDVMYHARYATHGLTELVNVHPFHIGETDAVLAHNGVLHNVDVPRTDWRSDTRFYVEEDLAKRNLKFLDNRRKRKRLESWIKGSKFVIMTNEPTLKRNVYILNEQDGHWDGGTWWSNSSYEPYIPYSRRHGYHGYGFGYGLFGLGEYEEDIKVGAVDRMLEDVAEPIAQNICPLCESVLSEDEIVIFGYCHTCGLCLMCEEDSNDCMCYEPASIRNYRAKEKEQDSGWHAYVDARGAWDL